MVNLLPENEAGMAKQKIRLSILDQSIVKKGGTAAGAIAETIETVKLAEELGYHRFWVSEHHNSVMIAGSAPEVLMVKLAEFTDVIMKTSPCNEHGEFYAYLKFNITNPGNKGFLVKVNGVAFDTLGYGQDYYKIGPLKGDCPTFYHFVIIDRQYECREEYSFTEKICCDNIKCSLKEPLLTFLPCEQERYSILCNFTYTSSSKQFKVKVNGAFIGTYNYADLPVTLPGSNQRLPMK